MPRRFNRFNEFIQVEVPGFRLRLAERAPLTPPDSPIPDVLPLHQQPPISPPPNQQPPLTPPHHQKPPVSPPRNPQPPLTPPHHQKPPVSSPHNQQPPLTPPHNQQPPLTPPHNQQPPISPPHHQQPPISPPPNQQPPLTPPHNQQPPISSPHQQTTNSLTSLQNETLNQLENFDFPMRANKMSIGPNGEKLVIVRYSRYYEKNKNINFTGIVETATREPKFPLITELLKERQPTRGKRVYCCPYCGAISKPGYKKTIDRHIDPRPRPARDGSIANNRPACGFRRREEPMVNGIWLPAKLRPKFVL